MKVYRQNRMNRIVISTVLFIILNAILIGTYIATKEMDILSIVTIILMFIAYLFYCTHAVLETIKYKKQIPVIEITKDEIRVNRFFKTDIIKRDHITTYKMGADTFKTRSLKYIEITYRRNTKLQYYRIYDVYNTSIEYIYDYL